LSRVSMAIFLAVLKQSVVARAAVSRGNTTEDTS